MYRYTKLYYISSQVIIVVTSGNILVIIPTFNEEQTIAEVIDKCKSYSKNIIVIDGNSTDNTKAIAESSGARVIVQNGHGKGNAILEGFKQTNGSTDAVVIVDGDETYDLVDLPRLVDPILNDNADIMIADRLAKRGNSDAFSHLNRFGNRLISNLIGLLHGTEKVDVLSGFRAINMEVVNFYKENLEYQGFEVEAEMTILAKKAGFSLNSIPSNYFPRPDGSKSKLSPFIDGLKITYSVIKMKFRNID